MNEVFQINYEAIVELKSQAVFVQDLPYRSALESLKHNNSGKYAMFIQTTY